MTSQSNEPNHQHLRDVFDGLPGVERNILQLLSVVFISINRSDLASCLQDSEIKDSNEKPFSPMGLSVILVKFKNLGLIENRNYGQFRCVDAVSAYITQSAQEDGHLSHMAKIVQQRWPAISAYVLANRLNGFDMGWREIRIAVYDQNSEMVEKFLNLCLAQFPDETILKPPLVYICDFPFDPEWFANLPSSIQSQALRDIVFHRLSNFENVSDLLEFIQLSRIPEYAGKEASQFNQCLIAIHIFRGDLKEARVILDSGREVADEAAMRGWLHFFCGENDAALVCFENALTDLRRVSRKRKAFFTDLSGLFYLLALLKTGEQERYKQISEILDGMKKSKTILAIPSCRIIESVLLAKHNKIHLALSKIDEMVLLAHRTFTWKSMIFKQPRKHDLLTELLIMVGRYWIDNTITNERSASLTHLYKTALDNGYRWAAMEAATLLSVIDKTTEDHAKDAATIRAETGMNSIISIIAREEPWERALTALLQLGQSVTSDSSKVASKSRVAWFIQISGNRVEIQPKEQSITSRGNWTKNKLIPLRKFATEPDHFNFLTEHDHKIFTTMIGSMGYNYGIYNSNNNKRAMLALVGHPVVFLQDKPSIKVDVVKIEPELLVQQRGDKIQVKFVGDFTGEEVVVTQTSPTRIEVMEITPAHKQLATALGPKGLDIPRDSKSRVLQAVEALSSLVTIHSGIGGTLENVLEIPSDPRPRIHLLPFGVGLRVNLFVCPFNEAGPSFQPGIGGRTLIAEVNGKRAQTHRDLKDEKLRADAAVAACPTLVGTDNGSWDWVIDDPETCLEMLLELQALGDQAVVAWPEGEKFRVTRQVSTDSLRVKIQKDNDWFAFNGTLEIDESLTLEMQHLLDLMKNRESRFIPLGDGQFIALTETLRRRMKEIEALSEKSDQGRRFHPLASLVLQDLGDDVGAFKSDKHWKSHLQRFQQAQDLQPEVPAALQAELREYQVDGFRWLARLSAWGVGACLADDMGLGKTLQALALILYRATKGPSLVVAPTSVCLNWLSEIDRFAPSINGIFFGTSQRQDTVAGLKPFDCLICSYGLFELESQLLSSRVWNVVVLDEAQAIKNRLTKRSKAAMALQGSFRMIVTGTPMENHLGELWNLFSFINPGLLGSLDSFNSRFAVPIEKYGDKATGKRLKKLIQPFLLRRIKSQVLEELPSRTEIMLHVEMSPEESAFYEALRRQAVEQIANLEGPAGQKHLQILAEIMKLRRACCNSRLIVPESSIASTKLDLFWELVSELLENRHKALVFSQFIDHLSIIRKLLDEKKVSYQYLDGSTPAKERQRLVNAFQSGEGDLFLISLKAGGLGINLTAADTVIHMDPWWNPAVEDQASDRAHRIGQLRPVTIYRLVTKETIEEKIVDLHRHKRDLADGLLEGGDMSARLSTEDLLRMIRHQP